ncbi:NAD(P)/FAD-dependent oxidoreductase [Tissierella sp. Yu-01]|uniref:NAD(P)/FAD-dependent oxidoreductase n=1 Tax=Tissierella sp. Yu-01 TaxID=3035694 RepID=UPI00240D808A|nr:NAD(P)/FAD-dependent oxidoreductase [Tissierella sp. Yu-01]WFA09720.1 NAD(P)/FAD-dependent oxidoreductase [Tissierella sp. Yu-01]
MTYKIGVIGAGPAGIIAAGIAGSRGLDVTLIDKNDRIGKKLFITGKGRCNITNASSIEDFFEYIVTNKNFLYSSLYSFTNEDILDLLHKYGLETKVERGNRVFPKSDKSSDVIKAFKRFLDDNNVEIRLQSEVKNIVYSNEQFIVTLDTEKIKFDKLVLTTGGKSYPATGSTGDGYNFSKRFGHSIIPIKPSLVPIEIEADWIKDLQGLSLKNVILKSYSNNKVLHEEFGEMVFTHYGISGPIVLSTSNYLHGSYNNIELSIDFKPALDHDKLDDRILRDFKLYNNKQLKNSLNDLLPQRIIPWIIEYSGIDPNKVINQITKDERSKLISVIKDFRMKFKSFRPIEEAIVTSGGISTKEINPSTMESKIIPNLFFAGEVIDVDALTGGFNLQIAYSTGYLAGINV